MPSIRGHGCPIIIYSLGILFDGNGKILMCGLVGFIAEKRQDNAIDAMLDQLAYRGPDDRGVLISSESGHHVHLGQNRLAIQDTSKKGHQPFVSQCGNLVIVFNGEVYNFHAIKARLEKLGHAFISGSDTEVILYAYKQWGIACVDEFIGMFAFAILDKIQQHIIIVRDRAGVKPLYYYHDQQVFAFSSELKSFHQLDSFDKKLNYAALPNYFQFGYIAAPDTIFEGAYKLKPGHYLTYDLKSATYETKQYWDLEDYYLQAKFSHSELEIRNELEELMFDAVNLRMISDVPVGVFLSGGYDSSLVTALLAQDKSRKLHTYTIGFNDKRFNEAEHAKRIAEHLKTDHTEYYVDNQDLLEKVTLLPWHYDEPFADSSALPTMIVAELARKHVTVALSADGGDEVFCGYSKYFMLQRFANVFGNAFKKNTINVLLKCFNERQVAMINHCLPSKYQATNIEQKYLKFKRAMQAKDLSEMFSQASSYVPQSDVVQLIKINSASGRIFQFNDSFSFMDNMMLADYKAFMVDDVLTKVDRATMSCSLEGREPLLDHRISEFMARVPLSIKYKNKQGKYLARQILYKYLPAALVDKPKAGFQVPLQQWLLTDLRPLVEQHLTEERLDDKVFHIEQVLNFKLAFYNGDHSKLNALWFILMFQMWREQWDV